MHTPFTLWMNFLHVLMICITELYDCVTPYSVIFLYVCMFILLSYDSLRDPRNVCTYVHMYVCTYVHMYVCTYVCTMYICMYYVCMYVHIGCNRRNGPDFGRVFLRSYYTDITQNTYIQSSMVMEILAREV